ncbi:MAG TPA: ABC transporter ATP-binding protein [Baekduia sp.]|nr:ABC transporter ATP-binding protein [Baekduia sp.]
MPILEVAALQKSYGSEQVLADVSLEVERGEFVSIVGPSGCGKTTMLRCISGLLSFDGGSVVVAGEAVTRPPDALGLVFQDYSRSLLPWMSVRENVALPLWYKKGLTRAQIEQRTADALDSVALGAHVDKQPWQLSGGMQQRVAIARALAYEPQLLLMDEPFASVDAQTRVELEDLTLQLWEERSMSIAFVTHDIDEAIYLGDRIVVLTRTPTHIRTVLPVDLPRPRDQLATKALAEFGRLRGEVFAALGHVVPQEA